MIELIPVPVDGVIGVRIDGKIDKAGMERVAEAAKQLLDSHQRIGVYVEVVAMAGISFDALVSDMAFALPRLSRFAGKAIVTDRPGVEKSSAFIEKLLPAGKLRHFPMAQKDVALAWLAEVRA